MKSLYSTRAAARRMAVVFACAFQLSTSLSALDYYWVNGSGSWSQFATHWAKIPNPTLPAHFHANVPTADDDVFFGDTNGGAAYTVNVDAGSTVPKCRNMDWTGVPVGTVWGGSGSRIDIYGSVVLQAGMVISYSGEIHFFALGPTHTITSFGVSFASYVYFEGTAGGWQLNDDFFVLGGIGHSGGTLITNGMKITTNGGFYGSSPGKMQLGSSEIVVNGGDGDFRYFQPDFDAGASHIIINSGGYVRGNQGQFFHDITFTTDAGGFAWGNIGGTLKFEGRGVLHGYSVSSPPELNEVIFEQDGYIYNAFNYHHLTLTAGKVYTIENYNADPSGTDQTILPGGSLTALGAGTCAEFITIKSWQYGTHFNFVNNSGAKQTVHCVILEDCHATGSDPLEVLDGVDLGNTNGWIFTDPNPGLDLYWIGGAGDWNDPNHWSDTDGGTPGTCIPNGGSNVHFTALSGFSAGDVVNVPEDAYCKNMDWSGVTGDPEFFHPNGGAGNLLIYGSLTLSPDMDFNFGGRVRFRANNTAGITSAGQDFPYAVILEGTGTWELQDAFEAAAHPVYHARGTFKSMGHPMRVCRWWGNQYEFGPWSPYNQGAELFLSDMGGNSSTVTLVKSTYSGQKGDMYPWYEAGKLHAGRSHIIGEEGGLIYGWPGTPHDFWDVTFMPVGSAGDFLFGNILNKLTFLTFGNLAGNNTYIHEAEFRGGGYIFDDHTYETLTLYGTGGPQYKFQPYSGVGNTVQTITATGTFNLIHANCEAPAYLHNPTPGYSTTFRKEGAGTAFNIQHAILDRIYPDQTTGAVYTATNCIAVQPDVETAWNMSNPAGRDLYWVDGPGDWHDATHWSLTSGGPGGECPPTPADNVFFNGASNLGAGDAVTVSRIAAFCKDMDWTGVGNGAVFNNTQTTGNSLNQQETYAQNYLSVFGSLKFSNTMTNNFIGAIFMRANGPASISSDGNTFKERLILYDSNGDWSLSDDLSIDLHLYHYFGTLRSNNFNITLGSEWRGGITGSNDQEVFLGNSTVRFLGSIYSSYTWAFLYYTPGKFHGGTSCFIFEGSNNSLIGNGYNPELYDVTFKAGYSQIWGSKVKNKLISEVDLHISYANGDNYIHDADFRSDAFFYDSRPYHIIKFAPGKRYTFHPGSVQTIVPHNGTEGQFIAQGLPGQFIELKSGDINSPATIHMDDYNGTSTCTKYLFLTGMTHTGTEDIYVPTPGGDVFNNAGWQFFPCNPCPATIPVLDPASITTGCPPGKAKLVLAGLKPDEWANWYTDPAATTDLVYSGGLGGNCFEPDITGPATYYARVFSDGGLCESTVVLSVDITITTPPAAFKITGGGTVCAGSNGVPMGLDGSATGVSYQLQLDGSDVGSTVPGTGAALDFGLQTAAGTYTVVATTNGTACSASMTGQAVVTGDPNTAPAVVTGSNAPLCAGSGDLLLFESGGAANSWGWTGPGGFSSGDQNPVIPNPTPANSGDYTVVVTDMSSGCTNIQTISVSIASHEPIPVQANLPEIVSCDPHVPAPAATDPCNPNGPAIYGTPSAPAALVPNTSPPVYLFSPGAYVVTWTYNNNGVIVTQPQLITIHPQPNVSCPPNSQTHLAAPPFALNGAAPVGGNYTGMGINGGMFDPAAAGLGPHTITYTYTDGNGCQNTCIFDITVSAAPAFVLTYTGYCTGDPGPMVGLSGSDIGSTYQLQTAGGANLGAPVAGTGGPIAFGIYPNGAYRVVVTSAGPQQIITGTVAAQSAPCGIDVPGHCTCDSPDGRAAVEVKVTAPSGQNWTVKAVIGLYDSNSPPSPDAPTPMPVGTPLTDLGNNMYALEAIRLTAKGYWVQVTNGSKDFEIRVGSPVW